MAPTFFGAKDHFKPVGNPNLTPESLDKNKDIKFSAKFEIYPEIRIYENPSTITYEASIRSGLLKDYYITMSNIDRSEFYNIKFQKKPLMIWIWISVAMLVFGGLLRIFKNAKIN